YPDPATAPLPAPPRQARGSRGRSSPPASIRRTPSRPSETGAARASPPTTPGSPPQCVPDRLQVDSSHLKNTQSHTHSLTRSSLALRLFLNARPQFARGLSASSTTITLT